MKKKISLFVLFFTYFIANAQNNIVNYWQNDGLNASTTYMMSQDKNGFIWIGSDNGLFRFDGSEFRQFNQKDGLENLDVIQTFTLADGTVFIAPFIRGHVFYKNGKIYNAKNFPELAKIIPEDVGLMSYNTDPSLTKVYAYSNQSPKKIYVFSKNRIRIIPIHLNYKSLGKNYFSPIEYNDSMLYYFHNNTFYCYDIDTKHFIKVGKSTSFLNSKNGGINRIANGMYMIWGKNEIRIYKKISKTEIKEIRNLNISDDIHSFFCTGNFVWICSNSGGVYCVDLLKPKQKPVKLLNDKIINNVILDKDGNVWFSSRSNGLFFMQKNIFHNYLSLNGQPISKPITSIVGYSTGIIMGYDDGSVGIYKNRKVRYFATKDNIRLNVREITADDNNALIFLNANYSYKISLKNYTLHKLDFNFPLKYVSEIRNNKAFLYTNENVLEYDISSARLNKLFKIKTYSGISYGQDSMLVGTFHDLYKYSIRTKQRKLFLKDYYFTDIKKLNDNMFVGATSGKGIVIFNTRKVILKITEADGLAENQVKKIFVENESTLWASTNSGLDRVDLRKSKPKIIPVNRYNGLPSDRVSGCFVRNDSVFVGTSQGLAILSVNDILRTDRYINKKVIINYISIGGKKILYPEKPAEGRYSKKSVVVNLSFPEFISQKNISYTFKVEGMNDEWQNTKSSNIILNNLAPGSYRLKIYGIGYNGRRSKDFTTLDFVIKPEFWQTWWFVCIIILLFLILIIYIIQSILRNQRNKKLNKLTYEKRMSELELQAIKAQMNPHFVYNCLNSIKYLLYKKSYTETENYLDTFTDMIQKNLHYSEKTFISILDENDYLTIYLEMEKLRFKEKFQYEIVVDKNVNLQWKIPSLLIQPFVENAIKHGISKLKDADGIVSIRYKFTDKLIITIIDNGSGFVKQTGNDRSSYGIRLSEKRIDTFRQLFGVEIELSVTDLKITGRQGTEISLKININPNEKNIS